MNNEIATRYAIALFKIAKEENLVEEYRIAVKKISNSFIENQDFTDVLSSAFIEEEVKYRIIDDVFLSLEFTHILSWMKIIISNHRAEKLEEIFKIFNEKCLNYRDVKEGIVYSAFSLTKEEISKLERAIGHVQKCEIQLKNIVDATLLGGVKIVVSDFIYDGTALSRIDAIKNKYI